MLLRALGGASTRQMLLCSPLISLNECLLHGCFLLQISMYNYASGSFSAATGHATQVLWAATTQLGCAVAQGGCGGATWVCHYAPPGNVMGQFQANVRPPAY